MYENCCINYYETIIFVNKNVNITYMHALSGIVLSQIMLFEDDYLFQTNGLGLFF